MSNYTAAAYHPEEKIVRAGNYIDDYFGRHHYGVYFPGDSPDKVFDVDECRIPTDIVFVPLEE